MKTLQLKSILAIILLTSVIFISCKKDKPATEPQTTITGSWAGEYGIAKSQISSPYNFNILSDGMLQITNVDKKVIGDGTWNLESDSFKGVYKLYEGGTYNLTGVYNKSTNNIKGTWGSGEKGPSAGNFFLDKK